MGSQQQQNVSAASETPQHVSQAQSPALLQGPLNSFTRAARARIPSPEQVAARVYDDHRPGDKWYVVIVGSDVGVFPGT
jgi:hypothetical protein